MGKEVAKAESKEIAANILGMLAQDSEKNSGFENMTSEDIALPFLTLLQALSPQVRGDKRVKNAAEGDFFNTVTGEIYKTRDAEGNPIPLKLIPCAYKKAFVEWTPREQGGGYVKEHASSEVLNMTKKDEKGRDVLPSGNLIVTTAYHFVLILKDGGMVERAIISFTSTQLKKSRRWNSQMMNLQIKMPNGNLVRPPMFSHIYLANSVNESNDLGSWAGWDISTPTLIEDPKLYALAKGFSEDVMKNAVKVAPPSHDDVNTAKEPIHSDVL